ncbi:GntR family transcriptional regulator [Pandoraea pneumonica]|uniref:GntR family transcriptional regulator n=1 Tax=Pandoraea pneumonica TaxID=2508299 RepID=UPI003CED0D4D
MAASQEVGQRLRDWIYDAIRDLVERGKLQPGQRLTETHLAARFGVSRTPVREALFQLAREGLLEPLERGYGFSEMPMQALLARLDVKALLDPVVVANVAESGTVAQISQIAILSDDARRVLLSDASSFAAASAVHGLQKTLGIACTNHVLARCFVAAEDDFLAARPLLLRSMKTRLMTSDYLDVLVKQLMSRDAMSAEAQTRAYIARLAESCGMQA